MIDRRHLLPQIENQGEEPICVGSAFAALTYEGGDYIPAESIYEVGQKYDAWPGEDYDGTSLKGAAIALEKLGFDGEIKRVPILKTKEIDKILEYSSIVISAKTFLFREYDKEAYHAVLICGKKDGLYLVRNSWGKEWGDDGYKYMGPELSQFATTYGYYIRKKVDKTKRNIAFAFAGLVLLGLLIYSFV